MKRVDRILPDAVDRGVMEIAKAQSVLRNWEQIVGPALAERSWPDRYDRGIVWVAVKGSAWAQELRLMKETILERLRSGSGQASLFKDIRFGVRKLPDRTGAETVAQAEEAEPELTIREIAERRLRQWKR